MSVATAARLISKLQKAALSIAALRAGALLASPLPAHAKGGSGGSSRSSGGGGGGGNSSSSSSYSSRGSS